MPIKMNDKLRNRLAALLAKARDGGASDAEAAQAMALAQKLMATHGVSESDLESATAVDYVETAYSVPAGRSRLDPVVRYCGQMVSKLSGCAVFQRGQDQEHQIIFFGLPADISYAEWLIATLQTVLNDQWESYRKREVKARLTVRELTAEKVGFIRGFCDRVNSMMSRIATAEEPTEATGTALVIRKTEVAVRELEARYGPMGRGRSVAGRGKARDTGRAAGWAAGGDATVSRGLGKSHIAIGKQ